MKCLKCTPFIFIEEKQWLLRDSMDAHLQTITHRDNSFTMASSSFEAQVLAADAAANLEEAEHQQFTSLRDRGSRILQGIHSATRASQAEQEMWSAYDAGNVDFEIAADEMETAERAMKRRYEHDLEDDRTWDSDDEIGLSGGPIGYSEDDQLLAEVMASACELNKQD